MIKIIKPNTPKILALMIIGGIIFFHLNNFIKYNPFWGYDGPYHLNYIFGLLESHRIPAYDPNSFYGYTDNPPFYYIVGAIVLKITNSIKALQALSLAAMFVEIYLLFLMIKSVSKNFYLNLAIVGFFALLPVTMQFGYMILNYSLGFFFFITTLYLLYKIIASDQKITPWLAIILGLLSGLGMITNLANTAVVVLTLIILTFIKPVNFTKHKIKLIFIFLFITALISSPYAVYKKRLFNCFFCSPHHTGLDPAIHKIYPANFWRQSRFYKFRIAALKKPYAHQLKDEDSILTQLHTTLYGDYYNYLVEPSFEGKPDLDAVKTGQHFLSQSKIKKLIVLNFLGLPISLMLAFAFLTGLQEAVEYILTGKKELAVGFFLTAGILLTVFQFISYLNRYPEYLNISSAYLYPAVFLVCVATAKYANFKQLTIPLVILFGLYGAEIIYTFFML